jgi:ribonucleotide reductase alpha subunit
LAQKEGSYETFVGSPTSQGILQFDMWDFDPTNTRYDWTKMREQIKQYGLRNSLLLAPMPTASTSQILGNMECFEPITSNIYSRKTSVGVFKVINRHLVKDLEALNLWNESMKNQIILSNGSIQSIKEIPDTIKPLYKTVWEIKQKYIIDHALARQPFVDQSQSMNLYFEKIDISKVKNAIFYGWKRGIKTGCYYMKSEAASDTIKVVSTSSSSEQGKVQVVEDSGCAMCSA